MCDVCHQKVAAADGVLSVDLLAVGKLLKFEPRWEEEWNEGEGNYVAFSGRGLAAFPDEVKDMES